MNDYTLFYKASLDPNAAWGAEQWDLLISAFNGSQRVQTVFDKVSAREKHWLISPEYRYNESEYPAGKVFAPSATNEAEFLLAYLQASDALLLRGRLCIDITGFMRPQLLMFLFYLHREGIRRFDVL